MRETERRHCACQRCACTTLLARDNERDLCSACGRLAHVAPQAPERPAEFWRHPTMLAARESRDIGAVCVAYRKHPDSRTPEGRPIPQEWVAAWVGISQVQVCRLERGTNRQRDLDKLVRWARALRMPASYAWFELPDDLHVSEPADETGTVEKGVGTEEDDMQRRTLLAGLAAAGPAALGEPWERLPRVVDKPGRLTDVDVDQLHNDTVEYFRREEFVPARQLAPGLKRHIETLNLLLAGSPPERLRPRLLSTIGEALALYGWFAFDRQDFATAQRFYTLAAAAARDARDEPLNSCVNGYRSYLAESQGNFRQARDLLVGAQEPVRGPNSATTRSWLAAREAEIRGWLREGTDALRALERATTAYDYARPQHERAWTAFFTPSRLGSMAVTTYTRIDHPRLAATADTVLATLGPSDVKGKAIILADLATAAIHGGDYYRAADLAGRALIGTTTQEVSIGADRLRALRRLIAPRRNVPVLAELDDRLATSLA